LTVPKITIPSDATGRPINGQRVYTKLAWGDEWTLQAGVVCLQATWTAAPSIPTATLYYRYGVASIGSAFTNWNKFTLPTYGYVKIEFDSFDLTLAPDAEGYETTLAWIGLVVSKDDLPDGTEVKIATTAYESGSQMFYAVGFEYLLNRAYVGPGMAVRDDGLEFPILSTPRFNYHGSPNATPGNYANDQGVESKIFYAVKEGAASVLTPTHWSTTSIVEYLAAWTTPRDSTDAVTIPFQLLDEDNVLPTWDQPILDLQGVRVLVALTSLMPRQRGFGFYLRVDPRTDDTDIVSVIPFSLRPADVVNAPFSDLLANTDLIDLDMRYVPGVQIHDDGHNRYDRVRVIGGRVIYVWTIDQSPGFSNTRIGWTAEQEDKYSDGLSAHADYSGWDTDKQQILDSLLLSSPDVSDVFSRYRFSEDVLQRELNFPPLDELATTFTDPSVEMRYWFQRPILPYVPLNVGVDYSDESATFSWDLPIESPMPFGDTTIDGTFVAFDMRYGGLGNADPASADAQKLAFTANIVPTRNPREFRLLVNGTLPHLVAWDGITAVTRDFGDAPGVPIKYATIAMEADRFTEVVRSTGNTVDAVREQVIDLGDEYRVVVMLKNTIYGIRALASASGPATEYAKIDATKIIRDDRPQMASIANAAIEWYTADRRALQWSTRVPLSNLHLGQMVRNLQVTDSTTLTCNSCITQITAQCPVVPSLDNVATNWTFETQFAELDFA
jgi:hypothetical protein